MLLTPVVKSWVEVYSKSHHKLIERLFVWTSRLDTNDTIDEMEGLHEDITGRSVNGHIIGLSLLI